MTYAIVYDSRTGNTEELARAVAEALPAQGRLVFGRVGEVDAASVAQADRVYAGFCTNRGDCTDEMGELLAGLAGKEVFLFGTCGFGADETYFAGVAARAAAHLPESAQLIGTFMCQGRMPASRALPEPGEPPTTGARSPCRTAKREGLLRQTGTAIP